MCFSLRPPGLCRLLFSVAFLLSGCASTTAVSEADATTAPTVATVSESSVSAPVPIRDEAKSAPTEARQVDTTPQPQSDALLDRTQRTLYAVVDRTARQFDRFFGETNLNEGDHVSRGRLTVSGLWDQRDDFDSRVGLRARLALPALKNRARLIVGRGDTDGLVDGSDNEVSESLPASFDDAEDEDWLLGLGYGRAADQARGLDFGVGVKVSSSLEPYTRVTYRWFQPLSDSWMLRVRPRVFWQHHRGTGVTLESDLNYTVSPDVMFRWANNLAVEDRVEGIAWRSDLIGYRRLTNNRAISLGAFVVQETDADVRLQNVGVELRFRQRVAREWFFVQLSTGVSWPRELIVERRESNVGAGVSFEMRFGRW